MPRQMLGYAKTHVTSTLVLVRVAHGTRRHLAVVPLPFDDRGAHYYRRTDTLEGSSDCPVTQQKLRGVRGRSRIGKVL